MRKYVTKITKDHKQKVQRKPQPFENEFVHGKAEDLRPLSSGRDEGMITEKVKLNARTSLSRLRNPFSSSSKISTLMSDHNNPALRIQPGILKKIRQEHLAGIVQSRHYHLPVKNNQNRKTTTLVPLNKVEKETDLQLISSKFKSHPIKINSNKNPADQHESHVEQPDEILLANDYIKSNFKNKLQMLKNIDALNNQNKLQNTVTNQNRVKNVLTNQNKPQNILTNQYELQNNFRKVNKAQTISDLFATQFRPIHLSVTREPNPVNGNSKNKVYQGNSKNNIYQGNSKNNVYQGNSKNNVYQGNSKNKVYQGNPKNIVYQGNSKNKVYQGNSKNNVYQGNPKNNVYQGNSKNNVYQGNSKNHEIRNEFTAVKQPPLVASFHEQSENDKAYKLLSALGIDQSFFRKKYQQISSSMSSKKIKNVDTTNPSAMVAAALQRHNFDTVLASVLEKGNIKSLIEQVQKTPPKSKHAVQQQSIARPFQNQPVLRPESKQVLPPASRTLVNRAPLRSNIDPNDQKTIIESFLQTDNEGIDDALYEDNSAKQRWKKNKRGKSNILHAM